MIATGNERKPSELVTVGSVSQVQTIFGSYSDAFEALFKRFSFLDNILIDSR